MAVRHYYTILCERLMINQHNRLSLIDVFFSFDTNTLPTVIPKFGFSVGFYAEIGDEYSVDLVLPRGDSRKTINLVPSKLIAQEDLIGDEKHPINAVIVSGEYVEFPVQIEGIFHVALKSNGRTVQKTAFAVRLAKNAKETSDGDEVD